MSDFTVFAWYSCIANGCPAGLEIRTQVTQYVSDKIRALRLNPGSVDPDNPEEPLITTTDPLPSEVTNGGAEPPAKKAKVDDNSEAAKTRLALQPQEGYAYGNVSVLRGNAMKFLPNFFDKAQVGLPAQEGY